MSNTALPLQSIPATPDAVAQNAPVMSAQQAPDLSAFTQPGSQSQPNLQTAALGSVQQDVANVNQSTQDYANLANKALDVAPTPGVATGPHARLINMISGLALGADAFGKAIATHGKEGGVQEVQQHEAEQQQMQQRAQQAAQTQRNAELQQKLTTASANEELMKNHLMLATLPTDLQMKDLELGRTRQEIEMGNVGLTNARADFLSKYGITPEQFNGSASTNPDAMQSVFGIANQKLSAYAQMLPPSDPVVAQTRQTLGTLQKDPNANAQQVLGAVANVERQAGLQKQVTASQAQQTSLLPKNQQEAAAQLAAAQSSGDPTRIAKAQSVKDSIDRTVQQERQFSANLQQQNNAANKQITMSNTLAQKGIEDTNKLWTDPQHGFAQTRAQVEATKNVVAQAKNGSELAASLEPAMSVLGVNSFAGVHRISPTEYEAAGPAVGSLYRRLNAVLDKAGKGAVPPATLSEVNGIMDALVTTKYQSSLDSTRQIIANAGIPTNRIFVPDPNNYGTLTTLDKLGAPSTGQSKQQQQNTNPFGAVPR